MEQWLRGVSTSVHARASNKYPGFTLIELMIAVTIMAVLIVIASTTFSYAQKLSRDGRRISDLRSIEAALELYYSKNKAYPLVSSWTNSGDAPGSWISQGSTGEEAFTPSYMRAVPNDPLNNAVYRYYYVTDRQNYKVMVRMELSNKIAKNSADGGACDGWFEIFTAGYQANKAPPALDATICNTP